ncbi:FeoB-associated Cys-rich membrane protein [Paucihalobacter ruber]|uniref:FeoB-associated Cys-rich membrane protein n=1 Tax=Paucihalobacter ruber TaxID=2567861 RepID=A0A506PN20_9FLAO|nr:FeoB-associated Cys-rich membrane protein [Paucihalobacter ruber]
MQIILVVTAVAIAVYFLLKKFVLPSKNKSSKSCGDDGCGCS